MLKVAILLLLLSIDPSLCRRGGGGGGGSSRGMSAGRANPGGQPSPGGQFGGRPAAGGFPQQPAAGGGFGRQPGHVGGVGGGAVPNRGFNSGTGPGSQSRGSSFKYALAGAAVGAIGGIAAYQLGKAILHSSDQPFHHNDRNYYWGSEYWKGKPGMFMCQMPLDELIKSLPVTTTTTPSSSPSASDAGNSTNPNPNDVLSSVVFPNGTRPRSIVWGCKQGAEICCGTDCCPAPPQASRSTGSSIGTIILLVILVVLLMCGCCCFIAYKCCRSAFDSFMPASSSSQRNYQPDDANKYGGNEYTHSPQQPPQQYGEAPGAYPMQPYPQQSQPYPQQSQPYQQQGGYPPAPQPQAGGGYPAYPVPKY